MATRIGYFPGSLDFPAWLVANGYTLSPPPTATGTTTVCLETTPADLEGFLLGLGLTVVDVSNDGSLALYSTAPPVLTPVQQTDVETWVLENYVQMTAFRVGMSYTTIVENITLDQYETMAAALDGADGRGLGYEAV